VYPTSAINGVRSHSINLFCGVVLISPRLVRLRYSFGPSQYPYIWRQRFLTRSWDEARYTTFRKELQTRTPYICHLSIGAELEHLHKTVKELVAPAPTLEYLSLFSYGKSRKRITGDHLFVPDTLFNGSTPRLSRLKLYNCEINGKSQLLRGLRYLEIRSLPADARPNPAAWVDTLDEMPHLTTLALHTASPIAPPFPFDVKRTATLPSLTHLEILDSPRDCALALAHLNLPALAILYITATCRHRINSNDVQILLSYVVRHAHGPQTPNLCRACSSAMKGVMQTSLRGPCPILTLRYRTRLPCSPRRSLHALLSPWTGMYPLLASGW
jgi:hypothetical protein